tara:strand:+ start:2131 stop:2619 length:489 start_codon:yes stop_codon:yes gene_type:complete
MDFHRNQLTTDTTIRNFLVGGNATLTVQNKDTGNRVTYRVKAKRNPAGRINSVYSVGVLRGPDNIHSYKSLGYIPSRVAYGHYYNFRPNQPQSLHAQGFMWLWNLVHGRNMGGVPRRDSVSIKDYPHVQVWHEGRCCRCGRKLTVPESIATGIGPVCAEKPE